MTKPKPKKPNPRATGKTWGRITRKRRESLFTAWQEKQSVNYVAKRCRCSDTTVRRYRKLDNWDERLEGIQKQARDKADDASVERMARHIKLGKALQSVGLDCFRDPKTGKLKPGVIDKVSDAIRAVEVGVKVERDAAGENKLPEQPAIVVQLVKADDSDE